MIYLLFVVCAACAASIVLCCVLIHNIRECRSENDALWSYIRPIQTQLTRFSDMHAASASEIVGLRDRLDELSKAVTEHAEHDYENDKDMERRIAERIEKKWDDGLQSILNYNPLTGKREDEAE